MNKSNQTDLTAQEVLALRGLRLPKSAVRRLQQAGIYCEASVSIEYVQETQTYVLRGRESGGASVETGAYCGFVKASGGALPWLTRVKTVGRNGVHAIIVNSEMIRIQAFRDHEAYALLITHHRLLAHTGRKRPTLENSVVFHAVYGALAMELWGKDSRFSGSVLPLFRAKSGTTPRVPENFEEAALRIIAAVNCTGCQHCHLAQPPEVSTEPAGSKKEDAIERETEETGGDK